MIDNVEGYVMARTSAETERLQFQARLLAPHSAHLFRLAGITSGMRVLDVGCGVGDVSMLLAELVGPDGAVIGADIDPAALEQARTRAAESGLSTVTFVEADLNDLRLVEPVDAVVGRLILLHLDDPLASVRALSRLVRPGGIVSFQDINISRIRSVPATPLVTELIGWLVNAFRRAGLEPDTGEQIWSILRDAGLTVIGAATASPGGDANTKIVKYVVDSTRSLTPLVLAHGEVTEAELGIDTLAERMTRELADAGATLWAPDLIGTWARVH
jgi:SAM-dependent methyltransferase